MDILSYDAAAVDAAARRLTSVLTQLSGERARLTVSPSGSFAGPAAVKFHAHLSQQARRLDAAIGEVTRAITLLHQEAADIRADQHTQRLIDAAKARAEQQSRTRGPL